MSFFNKSRVIFSLLPSSNFKLYSQLAFAGKLIKIDSVLPPESNPNLVPLSLTKLNSTYLPLLKFLHSIS